MVIAPTLTSVSITAASGSIAKGATDQFTATGVYSQQFTATGGYSDNYTANITTQVTWNSSNSGVASIGANTGLATGAGAGSTNITATAGTVTSNTVSLMVTPPTLTSITITAATGSIAKGTTDQFAAAGGYSDNSTANITTQVTWNSSNSGVASIGANTGLATGTGAGSTNISATAGTVTSNTVSLMVTPPTLTSITITAATGSIAKGATDQFAAAGGYSDNSTANITTQVTWNSSNSGVASIGANTGLATGTGAGSTNISATAGTVTSNTVSLMVTPPTLTSITITAATGSIVEGATDQFAAAGGYSDNSTANITTQVTWNSSNSGVASIGANTGLATGTGAGSTNISATAGTVTSNTVSLMVTPPTLTSITITTTLLSNGTVGAQYGPTPLAASGGSPPYSSWTVASGTLPNGLVLNAGNGAIGGTPTASGTFPFSVTVKDSVGNISPAQSLSITIGTSVTVAASLLNGVVGAAYAQTLGASGGSPPYSSWTVASGTLPNGLTLNASSGAISGTPTASGTFPFSVTVKDSAGNISPAQSLSITIGTGVIVTAASLPNGVVGAAYAQTLGASGGSPPYSSWTVASGTLPNGLVLNTGSGAISGTATASGTFPFSATVKDSAGNISPAQSLSITIGTGVTVTATSLPNGVVGAAYAQTLGASGGSPPYSSWTVASGTLPNGLVLNTGSGAISGTATASGTFPFSATVKDSAGNISPAQSLSITIGTGVTVTATSLPNGVVGAAYAQTLGASGGSPPYSSWTVASGTLPNGLVLNTGSGAISGTPTASGTFPFSVTVKDSAGHTSPAQSLSIIIGAGVTVTTSSLPNGTVGVAYGLTLAANGGSPPYNSWAASAALPNGLTLNAASGAISGTPTASGTFPFSATVKDSAGNISPAQSLSITIGTGVTVTAASLPNGVVGAAYAQTLGASGGSPPYNSWTVASGTLPDGLVLNAGSGAISGTPTASGTFPFSATVKDSAGNISAVQSLSIGVNLPPTPVFTLPASQQITPPAQVNLALSLSQGYPLPLAAQFTLSFAGLPGGSYSDPALQFATGGTSATVTIAADNVTSPIPGIQVGDVAGTITVTLVSVMVFGNQTIQLPSSLPFTTITVPLLAPIVTPGSVQIANVTSSGFMVVLVATSTSRDLTSATLSFTAAPGTQLTGTSVTDPLSSVASAWFASTAGQTAGGTFELQVPLAFSGDTSALGSVAVTLTNSAGTSIPVSGGVSGRDP